MKAYVDHASNAIKLGRDLSKWRTVVKPTGRGREMKAEHVYSKTQSHEERESTRGLKEFLSDLGMIRPSISPASTHESVNAIPA